MALERRNGRVYHYTTERVGGRVARRYGGSGRIAVLGQQLDDGARELRKLDRWDAKDRLNRLKHQNARLRTWLGRVGAAVAEALQAAGWHQHRREWRRKRGATMGTLTTTTPDLARSTWDPEELGRLAGPMDAAVREKARAGDVSTLPAVDAYLADPAASLLWGDVGRRVLGKWVRRFAGDDLATERAVFREASELRSRLAGPDPSALDLLLAERVVVAWVFVGWAEWQYAAVVERATAAEHRLLLARVEMANRNLLAACRTLAKVRRAKLSEVLALVNVGQSGAGAGR